MARRGGRRKRGFALALVALLILLAGVFFDPLFGDTLKYYAELEGRVEKNTQSELSHAKGALTHYMLTRADRWDGMKIRRDNNRYIEPRLLMLPCPDNLGDEDLDGTQDPHCGALENKQPLDSGSRFGRLPWNFTAILPSGDADETDVADGLGADIKDGAGNRLWYAVSRNFVPIETGGHPLNLHAIANITTAWLSVVNMRGEGHESKVVAVILSPGLPHHGQTRMNEEMIAETRFARLDPRVSPELYFEKAEIVGGQIVSNYENDGVFLAAPPLPTIKSRTNDRVEVVTLNDLLSPELSFMSQYREQVGIRAAQNHPMLGSPLDKIQKGISAYYNFFGFYPSPAALTLRANVATRARHCAEWKILNATFAIVPAGMALLTPATTTVSIVAAAGGVSTVQLNMDSPFLAAERAIVIAGNNSVTLARLARMTLTAGSSLVISATVSRIRISAGVSVFPPVSMQVRLPDNSPLAPDGMLFGWLPEHSRMPMTAGRDGRNLTASASVRIGFMSPDAMLTTSSGLVSILPGDKLFYPPNERMKLEKDLHHAHEFFKLILERDGVQITLRSAAATPETRQYRGLVLFLTTDVEGLVSSPAIVYPWRGGGADTRDNLHPYPPCFDSRDIHGERHRLFMEDQPMHYAVAAECHYGGANCGSGPGLTVSIGAGVRFALPSDYSLPDDASYAATLFAAAGGAVVSIHGGVVRGIKTLNGEPRREVLLRGGEWVGADGDFIARGKLDRGFKFSVSATLTFPAGNLFQSRSGAVVKNVRALAMYSSGPLGAARCVSDVDADSFAVIRGVQASVSTFNQRRPEVDLRKACKWLDLDENADGDEFFIIPSPPELKSHPDFNDYFLLFGGSVSVVAR